jgi:hypothetical protein
MLTTAQKNSILYQSQVWVADTGYKIMQKEQYSQSCDKEYDLAFRILNYQMVLLDECAPNNLSVKDQEYIYRCIQDSLNLQNYPVAPLPFSMVDDVTIQVGVQGPPGQTGAPGADGTDAYIDVITTDPELQVITTFPGGIKTYNIVNFKYVAPTISVNLSVGSLYETGVVLASVLATITLTKKRDAIVSSVLTSPGSLAATYASELDLAALNSGGSQVIGVTLSNVDVNTTVSANISDGTNTPSASDSVSFVKPYLYGNTATLITNTHYIDLTKLIATQGNKTVPFAGTVQYFWFGYLASYPNLTQILDQNGFDVTSGFVLVNPVSVTPSGLNVNVPADYKFYRTTVPTTINGSYTFKY